MKNILAFTTAGALGVLLTGCILGQGQATSSEGQAQDAGVWKLRLTADCARYTDEYCAGMYGFTVTSDHKYQVGPGPNGQVQNGYLTDEEYNKLATVVTGIANGPVLTTEEPKNCQNRMITDGLEEKVTLTLDGRETVVTHSESGHFCFQTATIETGNQLHDALHNLAERYYPLPFPDYCAEAASAVHALYAPLQGCSADADCTYVNQNYDVVAPGSVQFVVTDNCSQVRPMIVGNPKLLSGQQDKVYAAFLNAQKVCGRDIVREECRGVAGFESNVGAPLCQQGVCRVAPGILFR